MEILELKIESAIQAYENSGKKFKRLLEDLYGVKTFQKDVKDRIKTIEDVLEDNGLTQKEFDNSCKGLSEDEVAYRLIKLLCKSLNEGWEPDWDDSGEYKYYPWFKMGSSGFRSDYCALWNAHSDVGSRLCFKSRELAEYAGEKFKELYKKFMLIK